MTLIQIGIIRLESTGQFREVEAAEEDWQPLFEDYVLDVGALHHSAHA